MMNYFPESKIKWSIWHNLKDSRLGSVKGKKTRHGGDFWWVSTSAYLSFETNSGYSFKVTAWQCDNRYCFTTCNKIEKSGFKSEKAAVKWIEKKIRAVGEKHANSL